MITSSAIASLSVVVQSEERHARNALRSLATARGVHRRGELATTYHWRQAKRHMRRATRARDAIALLSGSR